MSHAVNLPEDCSLDIVIPDYLQSLKRYLDSFAYRVRKRAREVHDTRFSTAIRMDDINRTLYLATREQGSEEWLHYTRAELETLDDDLLKRNEQEESVMEEDEYGEEEEGDFEETIQETPIKASTPTANRGRER